MKNKLVIIVVKSLRALESILARLKCKSQDIFWWRPGAVSPVCTPRHCHAASSLPIVHTNSKSILLLCKYKMWLFYAKSVFSKLHIFSDVI